MAVYDKKKHTKKTKVSKKSKKPKLHPEEPDTTDYLTKFVFTYNNYAEEDYQRICDFCKQGAKFAVVGKELAPTTGTPHLQGYINLIDQCRFSAVKKLMPKAYVWKAKGNDDQNLVYCSKDENAFVWGEPQHTGKRNDIKKATDMILQKKPLSEVATASPEVYVKYFRGLQALTNVVAKPRDVNDPPTTIWLWGLSGVGKTRFAYDNFPQNEIYMKDGSQWWDAYTQQTCILVDDFDGRWPFRDLLRFLDRYPYQGQTKGGYTTINSPFIIFTCEFPPSHFWSENELRQVERRFEFIVELNQTK